VAPPEWFYPMRFFTGENCFLQKDRPYPQPTRFGVPWPRSVEEAGCKTTPSTGEGRSLRSATGDRAEPRGPPPRGLGVRRAGDQPQPRHPAPPDGRLVEGPSLLPPRERAGQPGGLQFARSAPSNLGIDRGALAAAAARDRRGRGGTPQRRRSPSPISPAVHHTPQQGNVIQKGLCPEGISRKSAFSFTQRTGLSLEPRVGPGGSSLLGHMRKRQRRGA